MEEKKRRKKQEIERKGEVEKEEKIERRRKRGIKEIIRLSRPMMYPQEFNAVQCNHLFHLQDRYNTGKGQTD